MTFGKAWVNVIVLTRLANIRAVGVQVGERARAVALPEDKAVTSRVAPRLAAAAGYRKHEERL